MLRNAKVAFPPLKRILSAVIVVVDIEVITLDAANTEPVDRTLVDKDTNVTFEAVIAVVEICPVDNPLVTCCVPVTKPGTLIENVLRPLVRKSAVPMIPDDKVEVVISLAVADPTYAFPEEIKFTVRLLV